MKPVTVKLGQKLGNGIVTQVVSVGKGNRTITVTPTMYPSWKFKVEVRKTKGSKATKSDKKFPTQYYAVLIARNGEVVFTGETRKRKSALLKTINNLFPGVNTIDKTTKK